MSQEENVGDAADNNSQRLATRGDFVSASARWLLAVCRQLVHRSSSFVVTTTWSPRRGAPPPEEGQDDVLVLYRCRKYGNAPLLFRPWTTTIDITKYTRHLPFLAATRTEAREQ